MCHALANSMEDGLWGKALVADLMEWTFNSTDQDEKVPLAYLEMRAR